jgi:hypothetical protein
MSNEQLAMQYDKDRDIARAPEALIEKALDNGVGVETIERLLAMRKELKEEWAREQFFDALAQFQRACPVIPKSKEVKDKSGKLRYKYAPLDDIVESVKQPLSENGFSWTLKPVQENDSEVKAVIVVHHVDGHSETSEFTVPVDPQAYMNAPQKVGSARSFAMRYAFCNALGILTADEDNDAEFGLDEYEAVREHINALSEAETKKELLDILRRIGSGLDENDERKPILRAYYEKRKKELPE